MNDKAWNCEILYNATHSSVHTTISVLESFLEFSKISTYKKNEIKKATKDGQEFLLKHNLYKSDKTGKIISKKFTMLSFPSRWHYDILRALDYFQQSDFNRDDRIQDALNLLKTKQRKDGTWPLQEKHPGRVHFDMERSGKPSRWNTLRALRVLKKYDNLKI